MQTGAALPCISATMYIESHQQRIESIKALANQAFALKVPFAVTELWLYIISKLESHGGTGVATPLHLEEFQSQQWRRYHIEPATCREAWQTFAWPFTVGSPSPVR